MNFDETIKVCESLILKIICFNMLWINPSARFSTIRDFLIVLEYQNGSKLAFLFRFCQLYFEHICDEIGLIRKFFLYLIFLNLRARRSKAEGHSPAPALFLNIWKQAIKIFPRNKKALAVILRCASTHGLNFVKNVRVSYLIFFSSQSDMPSLSPALLKYHCAVEEILISPDSKIAKKTSAKFDMLKISKFDFTKHCIQILNFKIS